MINEQKRLDILHSYNILDTLSEKDFDDITKIASEICQSPISLVTLIDEDRQWFKSAHGIDLKETERIHSFCDHAIRTPNQPMIVKDLRKDERFEANPFVASDPNVVFYAGVPLVTSEGAGLGTLCVIDLVPKDLSENQVETMQALARQVMAQFELRKKIELLQKTQENLKLANEDLKLFAAVVTHDIKSPLNNIRSFSKLTIERCGEKLDEKEMKMLTFIEKSGSQLLELVDDVKEFTSAGIKSYQNLEWFDFEELVNETRKLMPGSADNIVFTVGNDLPSIYSSKIALQQVLLNLMTNAVKYNDKEETKIDIDLKEIDGYYKFKIKDNGPGIPEKYQNQIFGMAKTLNNTDKFGNKGTGFGLATVKRIVERMGGDIKVNSIENQGATFVFKLKRSSANISSLPAMA